MALDFPSNPTDGQVFGSYIWSASKSVWQAREEAKPVTTVSSVAPSLPANGDLWFNSNIGVLFAYYNDGNTSQWVEVVTSNTLDISGKANLSGGNAFSGTQTFATPIGVASGGTGANTLASGGYLKGAGTSAITSQTGIPAGDITSGTLSTSRLPTIPIANGGTGVTTGTGLAQVIPSSVAVSSGTGSVASDGLITFSGVGSIAFNSGFTSSFQNYRIVIWNIQASTGYPGLTAYLRASGTNAATEYWNWGIRAVSSAGITQRGANATTGMEILSNFGSGGKYQAVTMDVTTPQIASNTIIQTQATGFDSSSAIWQSQSCFKNDSTSYDGMAFGASSGTWSGSMKIYGYN